MNISGETYAALAILLYMIQDRVPWRRCPLCKGRTAPRDLKKKEGKKLCDTCR